MGAGASWWVAGLPPISGGLRAVFYTGLLLLCVFDRPSPLHAAAIVGRTERLFYTPVGVLRALGIRWVEPGALRVVTGLTVVVWIAAAAGFSQPLTAILTFLGFAFLHAVNAGALGSNHSTHSALYALFCLCFSVSQDAWSLDRYLASHAHWPLLVPPGSVLESGFARRLLLVFLVYCMFAGGVSKLRYGGLRWLSGEALHFYIQESAEHARWPAFSRFLLARPGLIRGLAWITMAVELGAVLALLGTPFRVALVLAWTGLHVGIVLVMMPAYWVQMWCYLLVLWPGAPSAVGDPGGPGAAVLAGIGYLVCLGLIASLTRQSEAWPVTSVPMYSNGAPPDAERLLTREELKIRAQRAGGGDVKAWKRAWVSSEIGEDIWIVPREDRSDRGPLPLFDLLSGQPGVKLVRWSQYAKVVRQVAIADLAAKPAGCVALEETDAAAAEYPASRFLRDVADVVRKGLPDWRGYRRLDFVCCTDAGWIVIGRAEL